MAAKKRKRKKGGLNIQIKAKNRGAMQRSTNTPKGKNIPIFKLRAAKRSSNPVTRKRATFALNARKWSKTGRGKR